MLKGNRGYIRCLFFARPAGRTARLLKHIEGHPKTGYLYGPVVGVNDATATHSDPDQETGMSEANQCPYSYFSIFTHFSPFTHNAILPVSLL